MRFVIIGNNNYSILMKHYIDLNPNDDVVAFCVEKEFIYTTEIEGKNVISLDDLKSMFPPNNHKLIMGIGYLQMGNIREKIFNRCKTLGYEFDNYIHPTAIISPDAHIGEGNNILEGVIIGMGCTIGDANLLFSGSILGHDSSIGNFNTMSIRATTAGNVHISNNSFLGVSSAVRDNVNIGSHVLVGAMAYVRKDIEDNKVLKAPYSTLDNSKSSFEYY